MRREFFETIKALVAKAINEKQILTARADEVEKKINSGRYSPQAVAEMQSELREINRNLEGVGFSALRAADSLIEELKTGLAAEVALNGEDVNDSDMKLLQFDLDEKEMIELLNKHSENPTMTQLILKNAKSRGLDLGVRFLGNDSEIRNAEGAREVVRVAVSHYANPTVFDRLLGDNSELKRLFDVDDRNWKDRPVVDYTSDRLANAVSLLSSGDDLSVDTQRGIIQEFTGQRGALEILRGAANRGRNFIAADEAASLMREA